MRGSDHDAASIHFLDAFPAVAGQAAIPLVAARTDEVLGVVAKLDDAYAHVGEGFYFAQQVFIGVCVLEAQDNAGFAVFLGLADVADVDRKSTRLNSSH